MMLEKIIEKLRCTRKYMGGVDRTHFRVRSTGEVFTPVECVRLYIDKINFRWPTLFNDPTKTALDNSCGDGQFLSEVIIRKVENGSTYAQSLQTTYGVDLMEDNCRECIKRLYMCEDSNIQALDEAAAAQRFPDYQWSPGLKEIYVVDTAHYQGIARIVCADSLKYDYQYGEKPQPVTWGNGLFTEE